MVNKYSNFEWSHNYSNDGTIELVESYPNSIVVKLAGEQIDKRQKYLDIAAGEGCDYVIVFDSDDYLHPDYLDWNKFYHNLELISRNKPNERLFSMWAWIKPEWIKNHNLVQDNTWHRYGRIIKNPGEVKYYLNHFQLVRKDDFNNNIIDNKYTIDGVRFTADSLLRTKEFIQAGNIWAYRNMCEENKRVWDAWFAKAMSTAISVVTE